MKTEESIFKRQSVREFSNKPVKFELILEAIDAANHAPFAGNINNLKFIIVESKESKQVLSEFSQQYWINDSMWVVIVCSEPRKLEDLYQDRGLDYSKQQAGAAIENMLLVLTDAGLASCWVGAFSEHEIKLHFHIPEDWSIEALIPIGYAKNKNLKHSRKAPLESRLFWEVWGQTNKPRSYPYKEKITDLPSPDHYREENKRKR